MLAKARGGSLLQATLALAIVLLPGSALLRGAPAEAQANGSVISAGFIVDFFGKKSGRRPCYARAYDAKHFRAHPRQRLKSISLAGAGHGNENELRYTFRLKSGTDHYTGLVVCRPRGTGAHCLVEGDGGDFSLAPATGGLRLTVGERWSAEGARGFSPDLARGGDDRVVILRRAPSAACASG
jgi:hypothetical protein